MRFSKSFFGLVVSAAVAIAPTISVAQTLRCGSRPGQLTQDLQYTATNAGFDLGTRPEQVVNGSCTSSKAFFLSLPEPEGVYRITIEFGGPMEANTTVRAEARRLMLWNVRTRAGEHVRKTFLLSVRRPQIAGAGEVHRKPDEIPSLNWDDKLTLGFTGDHPSVRSVRVEPAPANTVTVFLAGDSTVVDQKDEPWAAWGQMLPVFFGPRVAVANLAESGETIASFESEQRFAKIFSLLRPGDYLFLQFAHNDQKPGKGNVPAETYAADLRRWIAAARARNATPVLVTSMNRRTFNATGAVTNTLAPYPETMRVVAASSHVTLIDLNAMSKTLYEAIGEAHSRELFVYAPANTFPGQPEALHDDTHFNSFGAMELARCVVSAIARSDLPLRKLLRKDAGGFNPAHPDSPSLTVIPPTPFVNTQTPYGR